MLVETTLEEILEQTFLHPEGIKIEDKSVCGKCSKCGECCTPFLPINHEEFEQIQEYVIKNNIKPQKQILIMENKLTCPYYDGKKCLIYEVRPLICKEFYCYKEPDMETGKKLIENDRRAVNMWDIAELIEKIGKQIGKNESN